ncbi:e3 ubiquitin-protein ligase trim [Anaeramoeba flamelloides]|uniref:E3 ubiquitin-protein ligase trim n=1 Tax=Anaeramoeba flamelloides TaxID=1746091 RepID=A0ABQ8XDQ8_9EUKA|nr:e3 ubiquitin-protein ligase trim [Anaeramoeba flamelloides]
MNYPISKDLDDSSQITPPIEFIATNTPKCDICKERQAIFYCPVEKVNLCNGCNDQLHPTEFVKNFHNVEQLKGKNVKSIEGQSLCSLHQKDLHFYCLVDKKFVCSQCFDDQCSGHTESIQTITKASQTVYNQNKKKIKEIEKVKQFEDFDYQKTTNIIKQSLSDFQQSKEFLEQQRKILKAQIDLVVDNGQKILNQKQFSLDLLFQKISRSQLQNKKQFEKIFNICTELSKARQDKHEKQVIVLSEKMNELFTTALENPSFKIMKNLIPENFTYTLNNYCVRINQPFCFFINIPIEKELENKISKSTIAGLIKIYIKIPNETEPRKFQNCLPYKNTLSNCLTFLFEYKPETVGTYNISSVKVLKNKILLQKFSIKVIEGTNDYFDQKMTTNGIKFSNDDKTVQRTKGYTTKYENVCGKKIYSHGIHKISIKVDIFKDGLYIGIVNSKSRIDFITKKSFNDTYFFKTHLESNYKYSSFIRKNGKVQLIPYGVPFHSGDIIVINLDMDKKTLGFTVNNNNCGIAFKDLPKKVSVAVMFWKKDKLTFI